MSKGQIQMNLLMAALADHPNQITSDDIINYVAVPNVDVARAVALDAQNSVQASCQTAHFSVLTQTLFGFKKGSLEWADEVPMLERLYNPHTNQLNGRHLSGRSWGFIQPPDAVSYNVYATHLRPGLPCNVGMMVPDRGVGWGLAAVKDFNAPSPVSNPPPPQNPPSNIAARQTVTLANGSSALLTVSGIKESASLELRGGVEIALSNCSNSNCTAELGEFTLTTAPFSFQGYNVRSLSITSASATGGALVGTTLAFSSVSGTVFIQLTDGSFDQVAINSGVILARWDVSTRQFVMAFAFESRTSEGDEIRINGTGFGSFDNTAPSASITIVSPESPQSSRTGSTATVECQGPTGTTITLSGTQSSDREDGRPRLVWYKQDQTPNAGQGTGTEFVLPNVPLGSEEILLMAYDSRGFAANDRVTISVVDTRGPVITSSPLCIFPPNHKTVCVRIGHELRVSALDQCQGNVSDGLAITNVVSRSGSGGVVSFDSHEACLVSERDGTSGDNEYEITVRVVDDNGNATEGAVLVVIPHNGPIKGCLRTQPQKGNIQ